MSEYITDMDVEFARNLSARWLRCSERAREFAAYYGGRFAPLLPHVVAEQFDKGLIDERVAIREEFGGI